MKIILVSLSFILLLGVSISPPPTPVGVKIAINESIILKAQQKYFSTIMDSIQKIQIPDKEFTYDTSMANMKFKIKDIKVNLGELKSENISIKLEENSVITMKGSDIKAIGAFNADFITGIIPTVSDTVSITVKKLDLIIQFKIGWMNHPSHKGKPTISVTIIDIKADIDLDFDLKGILSRAKTYFEDTIQKNFHEYLQVALKETILPILNKSIKETIEEYPIYVPIMDKIVMDYSLISEPKIENGLLTLYINGKIVQRHDPNDTEHLPANSSILPEITQVSKGVKILISPYTINTALYSLFYSSKLVYKQEIPNIIDIIPEKSGFLEMLHPFNTFRHILKSKFGNNRKGIFDLTFAKVPQIKLENSKFTSKVELHIAFSVDQNGKWELLHGYMAELTVVAKAGVTEGGKINAKIEQVSLHKFDIIYNSLDEEVDMLVIKTIVNLGIDAGRDAINQAILNGYDYKPPTVYGMTFLDSKATIKNDHIEFDLGATFADNKK